MSDEQGAGVIRLLDDETVNTIAAGEVIERPASIVKELLENAVDAGADMIKVDITTGTQHVSSVQITDTGCGMSPSDAQMAFVRHATSKIRGPDDLSRIHTMGFRGEALASIAAVSRVTLTTRTEDRDVGTEIIIEGGEIISVTDVSSPKGTTVRVDTIFFNTPARRKFLKSRQTELFHIYRAVEGEAFAHPDSAFRLRVNGKEKLRTQKTTAMTQTIAQVFGADAAGEVIPLSAGTPVMRVDGAIVRPEACRPNAGAIHLCVNGRPVTSPQIVRAIRAGYGTLIPKGRFPAAYLCIRIDTSLVDVNVHPSKREIRLSREKDILGGITGAVRDTLQATDLIHGTDEEEESSPQGFRPSVVSGQSAYEHMSRKSPVVSETVSGMNGTFTGSADAMADTTAAGTTRPERLHFRYATTDKQLRLTGSQDEDTGENLLPLMRIIGQVADGYILAASRDNDELLIIDQHAAHERILYDQLCSRRDAGVRRQELLVPLVVELSTAEKMALSANIDLLVDMGFIVDEFGSDTFAIRAVPMVLGKRLGTEMIRDIVSDLVIESRKTADERADRITATIACRGAIKGGTPLTQEQMERLVDQLSHTSEPYTCPHGRPVILSYSQKELDRMFHRT